VYLAEVVRVGARPHKPVGFVKLRRQLVESGL
jgi:hypothetical protein